MVSNLIIFPLVYNTKLLNESNRLIIHTNLDEETGNFYGLMGIKSNDLKSYLSMTEGIFSIDVNGLDVIRCNLDSNGKVMAEMIG